MLNMKVCVREGKEERVKKVGEKEEIHIWGLGQGSKEIDGRKEKKV